MNLSAKLAESAQRFGSRPALRLGGRELSVRALDTASARVCALLAERGIASGERVAVMLPDVPELPVVYYGALRAGAVVVPLDTVLRAPEVARYLTESGARLLFAWHVVAEEAESGAEAAGSDCLFVTPGEFERLLARSAPDRRIRERAPGDPAVVRYVPGPAGDPLRVELTHAELARRIEAGGLLAPVARELDRRA